MTKKVIILGGGIGGLSVGYFLARSGKYKVTVLEKAPVIGGMCGSFEHDGFVLDYGAHKIYSVIPGILEEIKTLMGERLIKLSKRNSIYLRKHRLDYPLAMLNLSKVLGVKLFITLGVGYCASLVKSIFIKKPAKSYEEYIVGRFGRPTYNLIFKPLASKVWGEPHKLHPDMASTRLPASGGMEIILKLLGIKKESEKTNAEYFYYPRRGFGDLCQALREKIEEAAGEVVLGAKVDTLEQDGGNITKVVGSVKGKPFSFLSDYVISSIHLSALGNLVFSKDDKEFNRCISGLKFRHLVMVYVFVKKPMVLKEQWMFFPEEKYIFSRMFEQKQMNADLCPNDKTAICCDFTCDEGSSEWKSTDEVLAEKCIDGMVSCGFFKKEEVSGHLVRRTRNFYPCYDLEYDKKIHTVIKKLKKVDNLLLTGRIGMYNYNNSDHCLDMGRFICDELLNDEHPTAIMEKLKKRAESYKIVD